VQYVKKEEGKGIESALASGEAHINMYFGAPTLIRLEAGDPLVMLAGVHAGCFELFGMGGFRAVRDLKGETVAVPELGSSQIVSPAARLQTMSQVVR
jgi:NitT/TauT family transport system substrate-binding protein